MVVLHSAQKVHSQDVAAVLQGPEVGQKLRDARYAQPARPYVSWNSRLAKMTTAAAAPAAAAAADGVAVVMAGEVLTISTMLDV